ncbi:uncharacterized protein LOC117334820 [Pecten maximus]|uniref:uncharacterized protein LOC117334820 n=1 Tax=Pecten maximus TaxID=6579 RepID=UPI0014590A69|nr:uncharacterized protein LOC117334820 [Pecten maximus]
MSSPHFHTVFIKLKVDKQLMKRFEVNPPERKKEACQGQRITIQLKDTSSCEEEVEKDDLDIYASETRGQNQKNSRSMTHYVSRGITDKALRELIENKEFLQNYVRQLLEHNIRFDELDLTQNQLVFEVFVSDPADFGDTMKTCLTPLNGTFLLESEGISSGFESTQTLFGKVSTDQDSPNREITSSSPGPDGLMESVTLRNEKYSNEENVLDDSKSAEKECDTVTGDEQMIEGLLEQEKLMMLDFKTVQEKLTDKNGTGTSSMNRTRKRAESSGIGKWPNQKKVSCEEDFDHSDTVLKSGKERTKKGSHGTETQDIPDSVKFSSIRVKDFDGINSVSSYPSRVRAGNDTDVLEPIVRQMPRSKSERDESSEKVIEHNSRTVETFMKREDYTIEGVDQDQESTINYEVDVTVRTSKIIDLLMSQIISGQSKTLRSLKEVYTYVNFLSHMSAVFYKYHYYDAKSTSEELIVQLVAGLNGGKDTKRPQHSQVDYTQFNRDHRVGTGRTDVHLPSNTPHKKRFHNDKSKKWGAAILIKDPDKSGRLSPEGGNEIEEDLGSLKKEKGTVEPSGWEVKERIMAKLKGEGTSCQSRFFDQPDTDGGDLEQENVTQHNLQHSRIESLDSLEDGVRPDGRTPDIDPEGNGDFPSDDDLSSDREESDDVDDESDYLGDEDIDDCNSHGVRTVPAGNADSGGGAAMGAYGGQHSFNERHRAFLKSWNVTLGDNGEKCLLTALKDCNRQQHPDPSTMFLLDLSRSMEQADKVTQMKSKVRSILQVAGSKHFGCQMSETYGVAVFGHKTEVLLYPSRQLHDVQDTLDLTRFNETAGRSPLGLGLLLCTCVWFTEKGSGGTVWLHGRKVRPRIIVISDLELNETASVAGGREDDQDTLGYTMEVHNELLTIALKLKKLGIPVFVVPVGDTTQMPEVYTRLESVTNITGGKLLTKSGELLGRQTWQQILACNILRMLENEWEPMSPEDVLNIIKSFTGDDPEDMESVQRIMKERNDRERNEDDIRLLLKQTGEPGEQLWKEFPLGERVQEVHDDDRTGTVVGHLPHKKALVQWDNKSTGELESKEMSCLVKGSTRDCREYLGETHVVGSRVRRINCANDVPQISMDTSEVGIVLTLSALQPNVVYVAWEESGICRHLSSDICRFVEKDDIYQFDSFWLFCDNNQWQPFPLDVSKTIEEKKEGNLLPKTMVISLGGKGYRLMFSKHQMRCTVPDTHGHPILFPICNQAIPTRDQT